MTLEDAILWFEEYPNPTIFLHRVLEILDEVASGIETEGQDHKDGLGAEPESPTGEAGDAQ